MWHILYIFNSKEYNICHGLTQGANVKAVITDPLLSLFIQVILPHTSSSHDLD